LTNKYVFYKKIGISRNKDDISTSIYYTHYKKITKSNLILEIKNN